MCALWWHLMRRPSSHLCRRYCQKTCFSKQFLSNSFPSATLEPGEQHSNFLRHAISKMSISKHRGTCFHSTTGPLFTSMSGLWMQELDRLQRRRCPNNLKSETFWRALSNSFVSCSGFFYPPLPSVQTHIVQEKTSSNCLQYQYKWRWLPTNNVENN